MPRHNIRVHGSPVEDGKNLTVRLMLRFDPEKLGAEKTEKLLGGLVGAVADVLTPEECAELKRAFESEQKRLARARLRGPLP
jgi:hypothetical protein